MFILDFNKLFVVIISFCFYFNVNAQSNQSLNNSQDSDSLKTKINRLDELNSIEKYALKMLKNGYKMKSIILQTNLEKKRIKQIRKRYVN